MPKSGRKPPGPPWRNRVIELRSVRPADLADHPHQWRGHPAHQQTALRGVLQEIGIAGALLAYDSPTTGLTSIDGHLRKRLDPQIPWPTLILDVTDAEAALLLATLDPLSAMADADRAQLADLLQEVQSENSAVQQLLAQVAEQLGRETPHLPVIGFRNNQEDTRETSVWNKMTSEGEFCKFEFGELRLLLSRGIHDRLCAYLAPYADARPVLEILLLRGIEHAVGGDC